MPGAIFVMDEFFQIQAYLSLVSTVGFTIFAGLLPLLGA